MATSFPGLFPSLPSLRKERSWERGWFVAALTGDARKVLKAEVRRNSSSFQDLLRVYHPYLFHHGSRLTRSKIIEMQITRLHPVFDARSSQEFKRSLMWLIFFPHWLGIAFWSKNCEILKSDRKKLFKMRHLFTCLCFQLFFVKPTPAQTRLFCIIHISLRAFWFSVQNCVKASIINFVTSHHSKSKERSCRTKDRKHEAHPGFFPRFFSRSCDTERGGLSRYTINSLFYLKLFR